MSGAEQLGFYNPAHKLHVVPLQQVNRPIDRVLIPARLGSTTPDRYRHAYLEVVQQTLLVIMPGVIALMITADTLIPLHIRRSLGSSCASFFRRRSLLHQPLTTAIGWLFISQGRTTEFACLAWSTPSSASPHPRGADRWGSGRCAKLHSRRHLHPRSGPLGDHRGRKGPARTRDLVQLAA